MPRIAVLGGSSVSTVGLALALRPLAARGRLTLALNGRSAEKLDVVARTCAVALGDTDASVEASTNLAESLVGADVVLVQVRVGGLDGRRFDESFPLSLGLVAEETLGAGGFSNAVRTVPVVLELARAIEREAPAAAVVNLTNPAGIVQQAITRHTSLRALSVCDVPVMLHRWAAELIGSTPDDVEIDYYGSNHLGWLTGARDRDGRDRFADVVARIDRLPAYPINVEWVRALGVVPGPYLRYVYEARGQMKPVGTRTRAEELLDIETDLVDAYRDIRAGATVADVEAIVSRRAPHWYAEIVVPALEALLSDEPTRLIVQVTNGDADAALPPQATVELPARVSRASFERETPPVLPPDCRAILATNAVYEQLALDAIVEHDRDKARRALVANPLVGTVSLADDVLRRVWAPDKSTNRSQLQGVK